MTLTAQLAVSELQGASVVLATMVAWLKIVLLAVVVAVPASAFGTIGIGTSNNRRPDLLPVDCGRRVVQPDAINRPYVVGTGNESAFYGEFPWQARIEVPKGDRGRYGHQCGGIIITSRHVITAAHCIDRVPFASIEVKVGDLRFDRFESAEQVFGVTGFYVHHQFGNGSAFAYDIALLRLKVRRGVGIQFGPYVQPACLPEADTKYEPDTVCEVSGWGQTADGGPISETLRGALVPLVTDKFCSAREVYEDRFVSGRMFCAGLVRGGPDACGGDSGGPLVCRDPTNNRFIAFGIVSSGDPKGCGKLPGLYTKISGFVSWLLPRLQLDISDRSADSGIDCGRSDLFPLAALTSAIEEGSFSDAAAFPWLVFIRDATDGFLCTGLIVSDRWILGNLYCASDAVSSGTAYAAVRNVTTGSFVRMFDIISYMKHPNYNFTTLYDIALLKTSAPMPLSDSLRPVCLPHRQVPQVEPGATNVFIAWMDSTNQPLKWTRVTVVGDTECRPHMNNAIAGDWLKKIPSEDAFCAKFESLDDSCRYHVPHPASPVLAQVTKNGVRRFYAVSLRTGVVVRCRSEPIIEWFVHLGYYVDWIRSVTSNE